MDQQAKVAVSLTEDEVELLREIVDDAARTEESHTILSGMDSTMEEELYTILDVLDEARKAFREARERLHASKP